ncbi:MAG: hydantoinase/oxoprolinase family protein, partial [Alphaproteobacteria bacterium]
PLHLVREVAGRLNFRGEEIRPLDEASARAAAHFFRGHGVRAVGIASCTPMPIPPTSSELRRYSHRSIPTACCRCPA